MLKGEQTFADRYTKAEAATFRQYLEGQLAKVQLPAPDMPFLREQILTMYANPVFNQLAALG